MRLKSGLVFAAILGSFAPAHAQQSAPKTLDQLAPEIDTLFARYQAEQHIPGLVYGVVKDGKLAYVKGIGVQNIADKRAVTPDSLFRIASISKPITAVAILQSIDQGKLKLDDPIDTILPDVPGVRATQAQKRDRFIPARSRRGNRPSSWTSSSGSHTDATSDGPGSGR